MIKLKEFIEEKNINQTSLSNILGITTTSLYNWLKEDKPEQRAKIIQAINILAVSYFIEESELDDPTKYYYKQLIKDNSESDINAVQISSHGSFAGIKGNITIGGKKNKPSSETSNVENLKNELDLTKQLLASKGQIIESKDQIIESKNQTIISKDSEINTLREQIQFLQNQLKNNP